MALKIKLFILSLLVTSQIMASENGEIFFTDKYDANYFKSSNTQNTKLYLGSDLFRFLNQESIQSCGIFIDSFLRTEKINFDGNLSLENENRFKVELGSINASECYKLSILWTENYKIEFQKLVSSFIKNIDFDAIKLDTDEIIFQKIMTDELPRFYNPANSVNNTNIAFVIPISLSNNKFKKVFTHYNTKRYSARESQLSTTQIMYNNDLQNNQIRYVYPSLNRQSFLKNCLGLDIIESLFNQSISFKTDFYINQCISSFTISSSQENFTDFTVLFNELELSQNEINNLTNQSIKNIISKSSESLFYYSFYDIEKLKTLTESYDLKTLNTTIKLLNSRNKFVLEVSENNTLSFKGNKIQSIKLLDFKNELLTKRNSTDFINEQDSLIIDKLTLFLKINENYDLSITGEAKRSEYLFIEKAKKDSLMIQYEDFGYRVSRRKDLALYRALIIFKELTQAGISYNRLKCIGRKTKTPKISLNLFSLD